MRSLTDDPAWVLERYREAKELIDDAWCDPDVPPDFRLRAEEFHAATLMDECTTLGPDCRCNGRDATAPAPTLPLPRDIWTIAVCPTCRVAQADGAPVNGAGKLTCSGWRTPEQDVHERVECVPVTVTSVEVA